MSKELVQVMREDAQRLSIDPDFGGPLCVLQELENAADIIERQQQFMDFCIRWAWDKDGSGTSDSEKLGCIKHHPILTDYRRSLSQ